MGWRFIRESGVYRYTIVYTAEWSSQGVNETGSTIIQTIREITQILYLISIRNTLLEVSLYLSTDRCILSSK